MPKGFSKIIIFSLVLHIIGFTLFNYSHKSWLHKKSSKKETVTWVKVSRGFMKKQEGNLAKKTKSIPKSTIRDKKKATSTGNTQKTKKNNVFKSKTTEKPKKSPPPPVKKKSAPKKSPPPKKISPKKIKPKKVEPPKKTEEEILMEKALAKLANEVQNREETIIEEAQIDDDHGGHSASGTEDKDLTQNEKLANYVTQIIEEIQKQWVLLPQEERKMITASVVVEVKQDGTIKNISFEKKSGDISFDISVTRAIERAAPFYIPDDEIGQKIINEGFLIEFKPQSVVSK